MTFREFYNEIISHDNQWQLDTEMINEYYRYYNECMIRLMNLGYGGGSYRNDN